MAVAGMAGLPPAWHVATTFQPLYSVHATTLVGFEALARPVSSSGEPVGPADFLATRTEAGIPRVDREWRRGHLARFASVDEGVGLLHLNIHPKALAGDAIEELHDDIALHGLAPSRVCLEILEAPAPDESRLARTAAACRALGMQVAIDGFGIAHSNIDRVARIGPDLVKIHRPALDAAAGPDLSRRILPSLVGLLHEAGVQVVVSGLGDVTSALCAVEAGADVVQGFYFGAPRPGLLPDPMATELLCRLKRLRGTGAGPYGGDEEPEFTRPQRQPAGDPAPDVAG